MDLTIDQVKDFLLLRRIKPSEVFREEDLTKDEVIRTKIKAEFDMRERLQKEFDALKQTSSEKLTGLEAKNKELMQTLTTGKAQTLAQAIVAERKLPAEKAKFITDIKLPGFKIDGDVIEDAAIKGQLDKFIDASLDEYGKLEAVFKPAAADGGTGKEGDNGKGGNKDELLARNI